MKTLMTKATSALSGALLFAVGCVMAALGIATMGMLALFALAAVGLALLAAPLVAMAHDAPAEPQEATDTTVAA